MMTLNLYKALNLYPQRLTNNHFSLTYQVTLACITQTEIYKLLSFMSTQRLQHFPLILIAQKLQANRNYINTTCICLDI